MIIGERMHFRAAERSDLPTFVKWHNDTEVMAWLGIYCPFSLAEEQLWFDKLLTHPPDEQAMVIEISQDVAAAHEGWLMIGTIGFGQIDWRNRSVEFGISIGEKEFWNQGYGTQAVRLLAKYGFETLNLHRIFLQVLSTNPRAIRAYEKAGFTHEVTMRQAEFRNGRYIDMLVMSMLKDEFLRGRSRSA